jgi:hypothetical protein
MNKKFKPYFYIAFILIAIFSFVTLFPNGLRGELTIDYFQIGLISFLLTIILIALAFFIVKKTKIKAIIVILLSIFILIFSIILFMLNALTSINPLHPTVYLATIMFITSITGIIKSILILTGKKKDFD